MSSDDISNPSVRNNNLEHQTSVLSGQAPRISKLAISSFVLGLMSLLCNVLTGLIGFLLGVIAVFKIGNSQGRLCSYF